MLKLRTPTAATEPDLASLEKRRASLAARQAKAATAAQFATSARRALLVGSDEPDAKALSAADRACREAVDDEAAAADALAEIDARIAAEKERLALIREKEDRDRHAAAIEASAKAADAALDRIRRAAGELDSARRDLVAALLPEAVPCYSPPGNAVEWGPRYLTAVIDYDHHYSREVRETLDVEKVAARLVGHLVSGALPGLGIARLEDAVGVGVNGLSTPVLAPVEGDVAQSLLTDPMRAAAARVRDGLPDAAPPDAKPVRRRADRWTTDLEGRNTDADGKLVDGLGFYVDEVAA